MQMFAILVAVFLTSSAPAHAGVVVSVWSPGVVVFDPYTPEYMPAPRPDYVWIPGGYDPYGYYVPGYWQPVATNPGHVWAAGYWSGRTYHEGYWRPATQPGRAWIDGYYVKGRHVGPRWVPEKHAERAHKKAHSHVERGERKHR